MTGPKPIPTYGVAREADDRKLGMTLDELGQFVQACMKLEQPGDTPIRVTVGWRGQIEVLRSRPRTITRAEE